MVVRGSLVCLLVCLGWPVGSPHFARANGAFPESLQILLPADRPQQIVLATNFGLIISDDGGATWTWTCEQRETFYGNLYAVGPSPQNRFYGLSPMKGLAFSDDDSCSWRLGGGALALATAKDFFPDPTDSARVLVIGSLPAGGTTIDQVFVSHDGGGTFGGAPIYTAPAEGALIGVETARADPGVIYLSLYVTTSTTPTIHPKLVRSADGGITWTTLDVEPMLGPHKFRIIAVDPVSVDTIYLRVEEATSESVAVSRDGGRTFAKPITVDFGIITSFVRLASGTVLVGAIAGPAGLGFRSTDGGASFREWAGAPHVRALAERDGLLYVAATNYTDRWAIGVSTDEGMTIQPMATYDQVSRIRPCAQAACEVNCGTQAVAEIWPPEVCRPDRPDGGTPLLPPTENGGCGCRADAGSSALPLALLVVAGLLGAKRARRR
jgi:MYXO-CTERM domain-containing protein